MDTVRAAFVAETRLLTFVAAAAFVHGCYSAFEHLAPYHGPTAAARLVRCATPRAVAPITTSIVHENSLDAPHYLGGGGGAAARRREIAGPAALPRAAPAAAAAPRAAAAPPTVARPGDAPAEPVAETRAAAPTRKHRLNTACTFVIAPGASGANFCYELTECLRRLGHADGG